MENEIPIGLLLLRAFEWFDEGLLNELSAAGWPRQNRTQSLLFANLDRDGTRPSVLAGRLGVTRQAVHQTVMALEESGLVTLQPDPSSGRAKLVKLTPVGGKIVSDARAAFQRLEAKLADRIGNQNSHQLRRALEQDWGPPSGSSAD